MPEHHPDIHFLSEYAAGTLCEAHALCISAHLEHCDECRAIVAQLTEIGASLFEYCPLELQDRTGLSTHDVAPQQSSLDRLFTSIDSLGNTAEKSYIELDSSGAPVPAGQTDRNIDQLGSTVKALLKEDSEFKWEKVGRKLQIGRIRFADSQKEVALHRISPGGRIGVHDHKGEEITVILEGSFSDENGIYKAGDFLFKTQGEEHQPIASNDSVCTCLTVLDAPIKFTRGAHRLLNPFLKLRPRLTQGLASS